MNNVILLGALGGGMSGAAGYFLAEKVHGNEKVNDLYPVYAVILFGLVVIASKFLPL
ncbi:MAG: hypothetical protein H7177_12880 [Rhizobacter sp.]|nr:hypothetical protein [Bacteriovorax sp.]